MDENGIVTSASRAAFRKLCILSAQGVLRGHESGKYYFDKDWVWWSRDEFLAGIDSFSVSQKLFPSEGFLNQAFEWYYKSGLLDSVIQEKEDNVDLWKNIVALSTQIKMKNKKDEQYVSVSSKYGFLLHTIIAKGWKVMAIGYKGDKEGKYDKASLKKAILQYDEAWKQYKLLKVKNPSCASLYKPFAFIYLGPEYHNEKGMGASVDRYRKFVNK